MNQLKEKLKIINGIMTDSSSVQLSDVEDNKIVPQISDRPVSIIMDASSSSSSKSVAEYEASVNFQGDCLQSLHVIRIEKPTQQQQHLTDLSADSAASTSNGSATSLGPFALPATVARSVSGLSTSSSSSVSGKFNALDQSHSKTLVRGRSELRRFFENILSKLPAEEVSAVVAAAEKKSAPSRGGAKGRPTRGATVVDKKEEKAEKVEVVGAKAGPSTTKVYIYYS